MMKKVQPLVLSFLLSCLLLLSGCAGTNDVINLPESSVAPGSTIMASPASDESSSVREEHKETPATTQIPKAKQKTGVSQLSISDIPVYSGQAYTEINNNVPYFIDAELTTASYEKYSSLDHLGR